MPKATAASAPAAYLNGLPTEKREALSGLRAVILTSLPQGFEKTISYGMIGYVVLHGRYPGGDHCDTKLSLPFMNIAAQKKFVAFYHTGLYADKEHMQWFTDECSFELDPMARRIFLPEILRYFSLAPTSGLIAPYPCHLL